jgi:hypothetical protein
MEGKEEEKNLSIFFLSDYNNNALMIAPKASFERKGRRGDGAHFLLGLTHNKQQRERKRCNTLVMLSPSVSGFRKKKKNKHYGCTWQSVLRGEIPQERRKTGLLPSYIYAKHLPLAADRSDRAIR